MAQTLGATYDPARVIITANGVPISGFADGTFVTVSMRTDQATLTTGADGEGAFVRANDHTATVEIQLLSTSLSNNLLTALALAFIENAPTGQFPLTVTDLAGGSTLFSASCVVTKPADQEYSKDLPTRVYNLLAYNGIPASLAV